MKLGGEWKIKLKITKYLALSGAFETTGTIIWRDIKYASRKDTKNYINGLCSELERQKRASRNSTTGRST